MGTHPIFESDFDCLTEGEMSNPGNNNEKRTPLIPTSPRAPYRDFGFKLPPSNPVTSENIFSYSKSTSTSNGDELPDDLSLLSDTLQRLDAEIETDIRSGLVKPKKESISNLDLLSGAMKRITTLENALKMSNQRAVDAEKELAQLKLITVEQIRLPSDLEEENLQLRNQIDEMETFLADYGLVWVGSNRSDSDSDSDESSNQEGYEYDWKKIVQNVKELNEIAGFDKIESKKKNGAQQLVRKSAELRLELYNDGILLGKGPFRAIQNCSIFLQDLQDGFFPAELQSKYPDGVIFDLHDFHTQNYARLFPGIGKSLKDSPVVNYNDPSLIKTDDLINMMPLEISESLPKITRPSSSIASVRESAGPLATIRVKSFEGTNHIIKMRYSDTIGDLRKHLRSIVPDLQFRILSYDESSQGWSPIEDESQNLIELKLTPRAALQLGKCTTKSQIMSQSISELKSPSYADKTTNCTY